MVVQLQDREASSIAATVAPEDLRCGDFVAILSELIELPSFFWDNTVPSERGELVRLRRLPTDERAPLQVKAICLPFVFVQWPSGRCQTLDVRLETLARLERGYAKQVWKSLRKPLSKRTSRAQLVV